MAVAAGWGSISSSRAAAGFCPQKVMTSGSVMAPGSAWMLALNVPRILPSRVMAAAPIERLE